MDEKIKNFLEKWDAMLAAANEIEEFKYEYSVKITSSDEYIEQRELMINGINAGFANNKMRYKTTLKG